MPSTPNRLILLGLIQDLQRQAVDLGLSRTAAALEVTGQVATEEVSEPFLPPAGGPTRPAEDEGAAD